MDPHTAVRRDRTRTVLARSGLVLGGLASAVAALVVDVGILWEHSTGCDPGPADPHEVLMGQLSMAVVLLVVGAVWTVAVLLLPRHRTAAVVAAVVAVLPAVGLLLHGLDAGSWVGGFCIPF